MSLFESRHASGDISLRAMFEGSAPKSSATDVPVRTLAERICAGGWPGLLELAPEDAARSVRDYLGEIQRTDIRRVDGIARDPENVARVVRSLGRNVATEAPATTLAADLAEDQPAWAPHLRSRSTLRKSPKRHFVDPSLAAAAVGASPESLIRDIPFMGLLFESLVVRDPRVLAQPMEGKVLHYRDNTGLEVDAVIALADGRWGALEIKLGRGRLGEALENLARFRDRIDTERSGEPAFLGVVVPEGYGLRDEDGFDVVPLAALGP